MIVIATFVDLYCPNYLQGTTYNFRCTFSVGDTTQLNTISMSETNRIDDTNYNI